MRSLRDGLSALGLADLDLLRHGHARPLYGVALVPRVREALLGFAAVPETGAGSQELPITAELTEHWICVAGSTLPLARAR